MEPTLPKIAGAKVTWDDPSTTPGVRLATASFDEHGGHVSFTPPVSANDTVHLTSVFADGHSIRGGEMCRRLRTAYPEHRIKAVGVVEAARGFWVKMEKRGIIDEWTDTSLEAYFQPDGPDEDSGAPEASLPADHAGELLATEDLPRGFRREAELTFSEEFLLNAEGELRWRLKSVCPEDYDMLSVFAYDEEQLQRVKALARDIKQNGLRRPVVIGPESIEGHHRLAACQMLRMESMPAYVSELAEMDPEPASLHAVLTPPRVSELAIPAAPGMGD